MSSSTSQDCLSEEIRQKLSAEQWTFVEFEGEHDRWDPTNFSKLKKWLVLASVTYGAVIVTCTSSLYVRSRGTEFAMLIVRLIVIRRLRRSFMLAKLWRFLD